MNRVIWIALLVFVAVLGLALFRAPIFAQATDTAIAEKQTSTVTDSADQADDLPFAQRLKIKMLKALNSGATFWALLIAFMAGILTSLMGCVYPLIPVVMAVIGTRETKSRWGALGLSSIYVLGMCLLYTTLGLVFAALGKAFGSWMGSPWVMAIIVGFFVLMGLAIAGIFEFRLPGGLEQKLNKLGGKGVSGAFLAGMVSGLVMAPCTGPVLSVILIFIAKSQSFFLGFWLLFFLSLGTGMLFLVIGTFSSVVTRLPKSGTWMEVIRGVFAVVMIGMAFFFLRGVWSGLHMAVVAVPVPGWIGLGAFGVAALIGGFHLSFPDGSKVQKLRKGLGLLAGSAAVFLIAVSFFIGAAKVNWVKDLGRGIATAKSQAQPVMLDFWATWCTACLDLDKKTFSDPGVNKELERFISVKVDCTNSVDDEKLLKIMEDYGAMDLPTIRFIDKDGKLLEKPIIKGFVNPSQMRSILEKIP
ncbi:MAG: sulfite exporter TauE/SafE family protein [Deltaproteobacteria bacterium]|nr:sulfite exporter TauE/SafE family protein [Deltaproteobacteria bacterium]